MGSLIQAVFHFLITSKKTNIKLSSFKIKGQNKEAEGLLFPFWSTAIVNRENELHTKP